jgi:hypothetical protein
MPRRKRSDDIRQINLELNLNDPAQKAIWMYWLNLTASGEASEWARSVLSAALPSPRAEADTGLVHQVTKQAPSKVQSKLSFSDLMSIPNSLSADDTEYVPLEDAP